MSAPSAAHCHAAYALPDLLSGKYNASTQLYTLSLHDALPIYTATVSSSSTDPVPGNNSATDTDTVNERADLQITKDDGGSADNACELRSHTNRVSNNRPGSITGATLTDAAAAGLSKTAVACSATP